MHKLKVCLISPRKRVLDTEVGHVLLPGYEGQVGILPEHADIVSEMGVGELILEETFQQEKGRRHFFVSGGYAKVENGALQILCDTVESSVDIDVDRAKAAEQRAKQRLEEARKGSVDVFRAELSLQRSLFRLKIASRRKVDGEARRPD